MPQRRKWLFAPSGEVERASECTHRQSRDPPLHFHRVVRRRRARLRAVTGVLEGSMWVCVWVGLGCQCVCVVCIPVTPFKSSHASSPGSSLLSHQRVRVRGLEWGGGSFGTWKQVGVCVCVCVCVCRCAPVMHGCAR